MNEGYKLMPIYSEWTCYLFGGSPGDGLAWRPHAGKVPNRMVRFMSRVFFGCKWVKDKPIDIPQADAGGGEK